MKLQSIAIEGFRAFARQAELEFGDTNVLGGPNGFGKTSLFDAVEWCLFGSVSRLSGTRDFSKAGDVVRNKFSTGECSVTLRFRDDSGELLVRVRFPGRCVSEIEGHSVEDDAFLSRLGFEGDGGHAKFLRGILLQQEKISEFVRELNPRARYDAILSLLQFTLPMNLLEPLDRLAQDTENLRSEASLRMRELQSRVDSIQGDISKLRAAEVDKTSALIATRYRELVARAAIEAPAAAFTEERIPEGGPTGQHLIELSERIQKNLQGWRLILDKCTQLGRMVQDGALEVDKQGLSNLLREEDLAAASLRERATKLRLEVREIEATVSGLNARVEEARRTADELQAVLASVRQVVTSDFCPVCKRPIPRGTLLETIDKEVGQAAGPLNGLLIEQRKEERRLTQLRSERDSILHQLQEQEQRIAELKGKIDRRARFDLLFAEVRSSHLPTTQGMADLPFESFVDGCRKEVDRLEALSEEALRTSRLVDELNAGRLLPSKLEDLSRATFQAEEARNQQKTLEALGATLHRLREAVIHGRAESVAAFLESYKPLVELFYARLNPHPLFSAIDLEIQRAYKESELYFQVFTRDRGVSAYPPAVFSTSQLNALALCVFLTLNIKTESPFAAVMMDDPIQMMDDLNVLGFCDLIRQMKERKQIFISTHDHALYGLLLSKLRPAEPGEAVKGFRFEAWSEDGPTIKEQVVDFKSYETSLEDIRRVVAS